ncbi:MAG: glutaminase [Actinomycetota bacterium]
MTIDDALLADILRRAAPLAADGAVADYIPALATVSPERLAMAAWVASEGAAGNVVAAGDADLAFSIQSISKVFTLTLALRRGLADEVWARVRREPSGDPFNSIVLLEREQGVPRNPFINAGAIVVADVLHGALQDPVGELLGLLTELAGSPVTVDDEVARSEEATGYRNRSLANLMKGFGNLRGPAEEVLRVYFRQCGVAMTARQLATATRFLANDGIDPTTGEIVLDPLDARRVNALMLMAGTYDAAGEFAYEIGLPCKSGVGGGIVGVVPDRATVCVWSPALDATGNSLAGRAGLAAFVERSGLTLF